jgi:hypothetical protein
MADVILTGFSDEVSEDKDIRVQLSVFRALGLSYYTVRFVNLDGQVKNVIRLTDDEARRLKSINDSFGINVSSIGSPIGKVKIADFEDGTSNIYVPIDKYIETDVKRAFDIAHILETKLLRGFSFYPPRGEDPWKYLDRAVEYIGMIADACKKEGLYLGLEVEANLVGRDGKTLRAIYDKVGSENLMLVFDGANLVVQGFSEEEVLMHYEEMRPGIGWIHVKDYRAGNLAKSGYVKEDELTDFVPVGMGNSGYRRIFERLRDDLPSISSKLISKGIPGFFLDLEPHLKSGGQFGGFSGPDGMGIAFRALLQLLDEVGITYSLAKWG